MSLNSNQILVGHINNKYLDNVVDCLFREEIVFQIVDIHITENYSYALYIDKQSLLKYKSSTINPVAVTASFL